MFKHILIPTDGSELSLRAVTTGIALAASLGASVHGFHVMTPLPVVECEGDVVIVDQDMAIDAQTRFSQRCLDEIRQHAEAAGVVYEGSSVTASRLHTAIVKAAVEQGCDLIVMGMAPSGWHGLDRLLLGEVTEQVVQHTQLPVLLVH